MVPKVLFVDDDRVLRHMIRKKLDKFENNFSILTAQNGLEAVKKLKDSTISLVVTDLQMPQMDGFALMAHLSEKYPDIPVIVQTGHSTPKSKRYALERGASGYIEKPFKIEQLADKIIAALKKESEGGILQTIPLEMFIQLIEMEQKTCTIRVVEKSSGTLGVLFFQDGNLMDARIGNRQGKQSAYEIFAWDEVTLSIQDDCAIKEKRIDQDLQAILFDAMRLKDEAGEDEEAFVEDPGDLSDEDFDLQDPRADFQDMPSETPAFEDVIRDKLEGVIKEKGCLKDIYQDNSWKDLIIQASEIGNSWGAGRLQFCYVNRGESHDFILLPGEEITVVSVDPKCPRDRMIQALK